MTTHAVALRENRVAQPATVAFQVRAQPATMTMYRGSFPVAGSPATCNQAVAGCAGEGGDNCPKKDEGFRRLQTLYTNAVRPHERNNTMQRWVEISFDCLPLRSIGR